MRKPLPLLILLAAAIVARAAPSDGIDEQAIRRSAAGVFPDYFELLSMPSDSISPADIQKNAAWLVKAFEKRGFTAHELDNKGKPLVFATYSGNTGKRPTILFYIHFDGQPVIPTQWSQKDPWSPVIKKRGADGAWAEIDKSALFRPDFDPELRVFARCAADDKGPIAMFLASFDLLREKKKLPTVDVKVLLDSEEETNSAGIPAVVAADPSELKADALVVFDAAEHPSGRPTILFGNRGVTPLTLTVYSERASHAKIAQLRIGKSDEAARQDIDSAVGRWAVTALQTAAGQPPVQLRQMGGTVPTADIVAPLNMPLVLVPTVNADDNQHTYDENLRMGQFLTGMRSMLGLLTTGYQR